MKVFSTDVRCLCCGELYDSNGNCPNEKTSPHTVVLAATVAGWLMANNVKYPTKLQIETVLHLIKRHPEEGVKL